MFRRKSVFRVVAVVLAFVVAGLFVLADIVVFRDERAVEKERVEARKQEHKKEIQNRVRMIQDARRHWKNRPRRTRSPTWKSREAAREAPRQREDAREARRRALTAKVFMETFSWMDMETIEDLQDRFPSEVFFTFEKWRGGKTRRLKATFPGGGTVVLVARPCSEVAGSGLCVWTVYIED